MVQCGRKGDGGLMITEWTETDIKVILMQLDRQGLPFEKYCFSSIENGPVLLGKGAFANVYEGNKRGQVKKKYAIKVIGFKDKCVDPKSAREAAMLQKNSIWTQKHIVRVFEYSEVRVWIKGRNTVDRAETVSENEDTENKNIENYSDDFLTLQFILMEKLTPVIERDEGGKMVLHPYSLALFSEKQIFNLVYDISLGLAEIHGKELLHRDVKLENIFYSEKERGFKLGDFGIAVKTYDGMASTVAFTKGYGAPEVCSAMEDKYDNTADIYSLGMVLYVLLNRMKFPGSKHYRPNMPLQYTRGNELPEPETGSKRLKRLAMKMLNYDPDDRPQSMEEVLNELESSREGGLHKYRREHKVTSAALAMCLAAAGVALWRFSGGGWITDHMSVLEYILAALCVAKGFGKVFKKNTFLISAGILGLGLYLTISGGMPWYCILAVVCFSMILDVTTGIVGVLMIAAGSSLLLKTYYPELMVYEGDVGWIGILLILLAGSFCLHYFYMCIRKRDYIGNALLIRYWWGFNALLYGGMWLNFRMSYSNPLTAALLRVFISDAAYELLKTYSAEKAFMAATLFCLFWAARGMVISAFISISEYIHQKKTVIKKLPFRKSVPDVISAFHKR